MDRRTDKTRQTANGWIDGLSLFVIDPTSHSFITLEFIITTIPILIPPNATLPY